MDHKEIENKPKRIAFLMGSQNKNTPVGRFFEGMKEKDSGQNNLYNHNEVLETIFAMSGMEGSYRSTL